MSLKGDEVGDRVVGVGGRKSLSAYMHHPWKQTIVWGRSVGVQGGGIDGEQGDSYNTYSNKDFKKRN